MNENPYRAPDAPLTDNVPEASREKLKAVAAYQKGILVCILLYVTAYAALAYLAMVQEQHEAGEATAIGDYAPYLALLAFIVLMVVAIAALVFVFLLALQLYSTAVGVLLGVLTIVPCIGFIVLLFMNGAATRLLKGHGIRVGLLGANLSKI